LRFSGRLTTSRAIYTLSLHDALPISIRSYRLFDGNHFTLRTEQETAAHPFLECLSQALVLFYDSNDSHKASLRINLDIYEMLMRSEEHTSERQSRENLICRLLLEKKK